jgi:hypothetical protein
VKKLSGDFPTDASKYICSIDVLPFLSRRQPIYAILVFIMLGLSYRLSSRKTLFNYRNLRYSSKPCFASVMDG